MGKICKVCNKKIREHTKKIYVPKQSKNYKSLYSYLPIDKQPVPLEAKYVCKNCNRFHSEKMLLHPLKDGKMFVEVIVGNLYLPTFCSEKCHQKHTKLLAEKKKRRTRHSQTINKLMSDLLEKYKGKCYSCGSKTNLEVHHIKPFSEGGKANLDNLLLICIDCHKILTRKLHDSKKCKCSTHNRQDIIAKVDVKANRISW